MLLNQDIRIKKVNNGYKISVYLNDKIQESYRIIKKEELPIFILCLISGFDPPKNLINHKLLQNNNMINTNT